MSRPGVMTVDPPLPVDTPQGPGFVHLVMDRGDRGLVWGVDLESGSLAVFEPAQVRVRVGWKAVQDGNVRTSGPVTESEVQAWVKLFANNRPAGGPFDQSWFNIAAEAHKILRRMLVPNEKPAPDATLLANRELARLMKDVADDIREQRRVAHDLSDSGAASHMISFASRWIASLTAGSQSVEPIGVTDRAG